MIFNKTNLNLNKMSLDSVIFYLHLVHPLTVTVIIYYFHILNLFIDSSCAFSSLAPSWQCK